MCVVCASRHVHAPTVGKVDDEAMSDYEALVGVVAPGKTLTVDVEPKNGFVIRYTRRAD